jgi:hypothetical protein
MDVRAVHAQTIITAHKTHTKDAVEIICIGTIHVATKKASRNTVRTDATTIRAHTPHIIRMEIALITLINYA